MPFLAPLIPAVVGGIASAGVGAGINALSKKAQGGINPADISSQNHQTNQANSQVQNQLAQQQKLLAALQSQGGLQNQSQVYGQLQGVANGTGPNPAQAALANATGASVANQAALMAGQRGGSANVGLLARQAAMQGSNIQQNAAGQAAALQAQQSLDALSAAGNMANTQAANQIGAQNALGQQTLSNQQNQQTALGNFNNAVTGGQNNVNSTRGELANTGLGASVKALGGAAGGLGTAVGSMFNGSSGTAAPAATITAGQAYSPPGIFVAAEGGQVPQMAPSGPRSSVGRFMSGAPAMMASGGGVGSSLQSGGSVPGSAPVSGNSYKNDKVKALLSPGELVVDRETMKDSGPAGQAARALQAIIAAKQRGRK